MARERRAFIVTQVWAEIAYTDQAGLQQKITKPATAQASGKTKHNLTDTEKGFQLCYEEIQSPGSR